MILNCPACSASYMVPSEAIGERGRDVRCKKCGHTWFQKSEKDALNELIEKIQSSDIPEDDISFGDSPSLRKKQRKVEAGPGVFVRLSAAVRAKASLVKVRLLVRFAPCLGFLLRLQEKRHFIAGGMVALALMSLILFSLAILRFSLVEMAPSLRPLYFSMGFPLVSYDPHINPEEALIIERAQYIPDEHGTGGKVVGSLINLTGSEVLVPALAIRMLDSHGQLLKEGKITLSRESIAKEASLDIAFAVSPEVGANLSTVDIRFVE